MQLSILRKGQIWAPHPHGGVTSVIKKLRKSDFKFHKLEPMMVKDIPVISAIMKSHQNQI